MRTAARDPLPRKTLLRRAAGALAAAAALGLAALLLGERAASPVGEGRAPESASSVLAPVAARAQDAAGTAPPADGGAAPLVAQAVPSVPGDASRPASDGTDACTLDAAAAPAAAVPSGVLLPEAAVAASGRGHRIQLGVFGDPANAVAVFERALAAGHEVRIESRVVVGPFADKAAAERAQRKLREGGLGAGMIVPPVRSN